MVFFFSLFFPFLGGFRFSVLSFCLLLACGMSKSCLNITVITDYTYQMGWTEMILDSFSQSPQFYGQLQSVRLPHAITHITTGWMICSYKNTSRIPVLLSWNIQLRFASIRTRPIRLELRLRVGNSPRDTPPSPPLLPPSLIHPFSSTHIYKP